MALLSDVFRAVRLKGALYFDVSGCSPLVAETPPMQEVGRMVMPDAEHVIWCCQTKAKSLRSA